MRTGEITKPRFEFRSFGQNFDEVAQRMALLSDPIPEKARIRFSEETYIISRTNDVNNTKIREGRMDIKTLIQEVDGLEQWSPLMKSEFPITMSILEEVVFPAFHVDFSEFTKDKYSLSELLQMVDQHSGLLAVSVEKKRFGYRVNDTICEMAEVRIDGTKVVTINSESTELEDIKKTMTDLKIEGVENINYLQAIKRVVGMINKGLAN